MSKLTDFLSGYQKLEEINSPVNGKLVVEKDLAFGISIKANGLTQSGGIIKSIWNKPLVKISNSTTKSVTLLEIRNSLILGLGGGTIAQLIRKYWPDSKITGVDIDPVIVNLGKKYLNLDKYKVDIVTNDAIKFCSQSNNELTNYELICVDLYQGDKYPEKFESDKFLKSILKLLTNDGVAIFNRLYYGDKRPLAMKFLKKLEKIFPEVQVVYPEANVMFVCKK